MKRALMLAAAAALVSCSAKPPLQKPFFDGLPHAPYLAKGNSTIRGQVLLRERGDAPVPCSDAMLATPATAYFRQVIRLAAKGQMPISGSEIDPDYRTIVHSARCEPNGSFAFDALPPGDWYVVATLGAQPGSLLYYKVRLQKDETIQIVMTDRNVGVP
jgi:hypothetical protein